MNLVYSIDNIQQVAKEIISNFPVQRCFAFYAEMGSGKTTLIRALCDALGVEDNVSSPTFSLINEYKRSQRNEKVFHMDWYRLKSTQDAIEAGIEDILQDQQGHYCFIEWPELAEELLPAMVVRLSLTPVSDTMRELRTL